MAVFSTLIALATFAGCRSKSSGDAARTKKGEARARASDLSPPPKPPLVAPTLPGPQGVSPPPTERSGGTLRVLLESEPSTLNPLNDPDASATQVLSGLVYQTLLDCTAGEYRGELADRWEVSPDGLRISLHLRPGVRWHDDRAFGVLDVQATLEPLLRKGATMQLLREELSDIASMEIASERMVRLNMKRPSDLALRALCDLPILPDHLVRGWSADGTPLGKQPVGTGPYRVVAWDRGKRIRLTRFRAAWGPPVAVDDIVFELEPDAVRALNRARRGDLEILPRVLQVHYPDQVEPATLHGDVGLFRLTPERTSFLVANTTHRPLDDVRVRRALALLWDRDRFARELHKGLARPIAAPPFGGGGQRPVFDRKKAIALLEQAGYRDQDADGVRDLDGRAIRLTLLQVSGSREVAQEARAFMLEMRKAGLLVDLVVADQATIFNRLKTGQFDLAPMVWEGRPDEDPTPLFGSSGLYNFAKLQSAAVDGLLDELRLAPGPAARRPILARLGALLESEQPVIFLYRHDVPALVSHRVHGLAAVGARLDLRQVWLDPS